MNGILLYPASGILVRAIEGIRQIQDPENTIKGYKLKDVEFLSAVKIVVGQDGTETIFTLRPCADEGKCFVWQEFRLRTYTYDMWVEKL